MAALGTIIRDSVVCKGTMEDPIPYLSHLYGNGPDGKWSCKYANNPKLFHRVGVILSGSWEEKTEVGAAHLGLRLNLAKCLAVPVGVTSVECLGAHVPRELLVQADGTSRAQRSFELLGAAVGNDGFVEEHTRSRARGATALLDAVSDFEGPQVGLRLLRACAGYSRLVHSMRCNPPAAHLGPLRDFDGQVQACLASLTGLHLSGEQARCPLP